MVVLGLRDRLKEAGVDQAEATVGLEPDGVVEEDPWASDLEYVETSPWFYWVPFPGVRYYSYDARPHR